MSDLAKTGDGLLAKVIDTVFIFSLGHTYKETKRMDLNSVGLFVGFYPLSCIETIEACRSRYFFLSFGR